MAPEPSGARPGPQTLVRGLRADMLAELTDEPAEAPEPAPSAEAPASEAPPAADDKPKRRLWPFR
jgi:hypothetical protein